MTQLSISDAVTQMKGIVGEAGWLSGSDAESYLIDERKEFHGEALGVVRPASTAEVSAVVELCAEASIAVLPQGGNTGLSGGSVPNVDRPTVVLSLTRMRSIIELNVDGFTITAEAGVTIQELQEAAAAADRLFAPDWGARGTATLGGAIATNAGGLNVLRFGTTRDQVMGLEVVLADGQVWNGLRALPKDNSGYDLKHLFIASEGTLGIVTKAIMKLRPRPAAHQTAFVALTDIDRLNEVFSLAQTMAPQGLSAFELVPEVGVAAATERFDIARPLPEVAEWYLLMRFSGAEGIGDELLAYLDLASTRGLISDAVIADTSAQEQNLWHLRDELSSIRIFDAYLLKYDLAVRPDRIAEFHSAVRDLIEETVPGALPYAFGHVGDGNLHLTVWPAASEPGLLMSKEAELYKLIDELTWSFGGTISAEHGIGQELRERIVGQKQPVEFEMMRAIKGLFDPQGILNPGKLLPDE